MQLHIPASVRCPPVSNPLPAPSLVPYAGALQRIRVTRQLQDVVTYADEEAFAWLDQDNNSAAGSGRIAEQSKQTATQFNFMYFRIRVADFRAVVNALAQVSKSESVFSEEKLNKWTLRYRFRLLKGAPIKSALRAFACRLGIESDADIVFCRDGFYGDPTAGTLSSANGIPHEMLLGDVTAQGSGLSNGSNIFVSRVTQVERDSAAAVLRVVDDEALEEEGDEAGGAATPDSVSASPSESAQPDQAA